ncbi:gamma-glutamyl-gamma-aminobutyrate hydrolase family protein [Massilibacteroides sp.]|uniref:gamma-glutamyl-gamma-aminobutyrate hydrolase family protein n=1 Tax=Massilibacteroides sp. TaxID=2034766 RepID=UPI00261500CE|nr:gamma-glutamyl-gamma-aminobutyrate hydrolase family protein [Massilibacteroides sp.]MDD4515305.1 gamma-glutamyl-gamma-aminobutyrate hydrolase family protein [Massilibacteroides sp.]
MSKKVRHPNLENLFQEVDSFIPQTNNLQPPKVGISSNRKDGLSCLAETYIESVLKAGGVPVMIPVITDINALSVIVDSIDGLILSGGGDLSPLYVGEEPIPLLDEGDLFRDEYDLILLRLAVNRQLPILGICRGHQVINLAFGGTLFQDIYSQNSQPLIKHSQKIDRIYPSHSVRIEDGTHFLRKIYGDTKSLLVNSFHHQSVNIVAPEFLAAATAPDGINEAITHSEKQIYGVQWHPEAMASADDESMLKLFCFFTEEARVFRQAKELHEKIITVDSHTDTPMIFPGHFDIGKKEGGKVNLPFMEEGRIDATFMVAYIPQGARDDESLRRATAYAIERLQEVKQQEELNASRMGIAYTAADIANLKKLGKKAILLGVENGYAVGKEIENLQLFKDIGVSYITLCHNGANDICDSARGEAEWNGLSPFGKDVVKEMNRLGIMIDLSHAAESTFYNVLELSEFPVIASHSSVRALCDHPRNLTDDQIKAIAARDGVVQVCLYAGFINEDAEKASLSDAIRHIDHIVNLVGIDYVGIGSDFDGDGELIGCRSSNELINITVRLLKAGYSEKEIQKLWGENLLRVMTRVQACSNK